MKKYLLGLFAIVLAVGFSAFTSTPVKKQTDKFFVYTAGAQRDITHYTQQTTQPAPCNLNATLCWFKVIDLNGNDVISVGEFNSAFDALDGGAGSGNGTLDDETEQANIFEKKN